MLKHSVPHSTSGLAVEAAGALARLDVDRLEEMAESCGALSQSADMAELGRFETSRHEMRVFARILEATRANLSVLRRLNDFQLPAIEYSSTAEKDWAVTEMRHGNN
jgi:hypothetical protein